MFPNGQNEKKETNDRPALGVVGLDPHLHHVLLAGDSKLFINLMFNRKTVGVPSESPLDMVTGGMGVSGDDVLTERANEKVSFFGVEFKNQRRFDMRSC